MTLEIEIWRGPRRLRPHVPKANDGLMVEDEPELKQVFKRSLSSDTPTWLGRDPGVRRSIVLEPAKADTPEPHQITFGADDKHLSRLALIFSPASEQPGWILECRNDRGAEVGRWAYAHRTTLSEGHWCGVLGGHTAVLLRTETWLYWVLFHLPPVPVPATLKRAIADRKASSEIEAFRKKALQSTSPRDDGWSTTLPGGQSSNYRITAAQEDAFSQIYLDILRWPPVLNPKPRAYSQVAKKAGERLKHIQSWAMQKGFLASTGLSGFSPSLPQFLADHEVIVFDQWAKRVPSA